MTFFLYIKAVYLDGDWLGRRGSSHQAINQLTTRLGFPLWHRFTGPFTGPASPQAHGITNLRSSLMWPQVKCRPLFLGHLLSGIQCSVPDASGTKGYRIRPKAKRKSATDAPGALLGFLLCANIWQGQTELNWKKQLTHPQVCLHSPAFASEQHHCPSVVIFILLHITTPWRTCKMPGPQPQSLASDSQALVLRVHACVCVFSFYVLQVTLISSQNTVVQDVRKAHWIGDL